MLHSKLLAAMPFFTLCHQVLSIRTVLLSVQPPNDSLSRRCCSRAAHHQYAGIVETIHAVWQLLQQVALYYSRLPCITAGCPVSQQVALYHSRLPCITAGYPVLQQVTLYYSRLPCFTAATVLVYSSSARQIWIWP